MKPQRNALLGAVVLGLALLACQPTETVDPGQNPDQPQTGVPTGVGQPTGPATTQTIGPAGGTVTSADGKFSLTVPAGALAKETPITIQPVENKAPNGTGPAYTFGDVEITVSEPVILTYQYREGEFSGTVKGNVALARQNAQGLWGLNQLAQIDPVKRTLTARVRRVSKQAISWIEQYKLTPEADTLVYLETSDLKLMHHAGGWGDVTEIDGKDSNYDLFHPMGLPSDAGVAVVRRYGVNGDRVGVNDDGEFSLLKDQASNPKAKAWFRYRAPNRAPSTNPVALSVELEHGGKEKLMLVSNMVVRSPTSFSVDGITETGPLQAAGAVTPTGLTVVIAPEKLHGSNRHALNLTLRAPKVGRFGFDQYDAIAQLSYTRAGKGVEYGSSYQDAKGVVHFMDGEVNLLQFDRAKGIAQGVVRGTLVWKVPNRHDDGFTLDYAKVYGEFKCKFGQ